MKLFDKSYWLLQIANLCDVATTLWFVSKLGVGAEGNPIVHWCMTNWGLYYTMGVKIGLVAFAGILLTRYHLRYIIAIVFFLVSIWNLHPHII